MCIFVYSFVSHPFPKVTVCCIGDTIHQALISHTGAFYLDSELFDTEGSTVYTLAIVNFSNADALRFIPM
jgi:hypothetical protein